MLSGLLESETLPHGSRPHNGVGPEFPSLTTAKCGILVGEKARMLDVPELKFKVINVQWEE